MVMQEILILDNTEEVIVAVIENRKLAECYIESKLVPALVGNVYLGVVHDILPGMNACFVDIGQDKNAYLFAEEPSQVSNGKQLKVGQKVIVQVTKEFVNEKGAKITSQIGLPGRYFVFLPFSRNVGISKKLVAQRDYYYSLATSFCPPDAGLILRTAAKDASTRQLQQDLNFLKQQWAGVKEKALSVRAPALLYKEVDLAKRALRDFLTEQTSQVLVDSKQLFSDLKTFIYNLMPEFTHKIKLVSKEYVNLHYELQAQLNQALSRKVWLRSGGYITIDKTEALTAIDVNTGKFISGSCFSETVLTTNLEAAQEIARQIRLRDLGGLIVIDFIDMKKTKHKEQLLTVFEQAMANDRSRYHIVGLSEIGLLEMTRKSVSSGLDAYFLSHCPHCENGLIKFKKPFYPA